MALGLASCYLALNATALTYGASSWANLVNQSRPHNLVLSSLGVTRKATPIPCFVDPTAAIHTDSRLRLLLVSGLDGSRFVVERVDLSLAGVRFFLQFRDRAGDAVDVALKCGALVLADGAAADGGDVAGDDPPLVAAHVHPERGCDGRGRRFAELLGDLVGQ